MQTLNVYITYIKVSERLKYEKILILSLWRAFLVAQLVKNPPAMWEIWVPSWVGKILWRRERLPTPVFWPGGEF